MSKPVTEKSGLRVLVRADASVAIGTGHVMRCVALARALQAQGAHVAFACRRLPGDLLGWLHQQGYPLFALEGPADDKIQTAAILQAVPFDWLVVDHYGLDARWGASLCPFVTHMLVLDDLANRPHACDVLLDQNDFARDETRYQNLVPENTRLLLGPKYALLRPEFAPMHAQAQQRDWGEIKRLLVFFGGTDPTGETLKALDAIEKTGSGILAVNVVLGAGNPRRDEIFRRAEKMPNVTLHCQVDNMAERMLDADLFLGAGGTTTWERLCLGLPGIVVAVADNQEAISQALATEGCQTYLGRSAGVSAQDMARALVELMDNAQTRAAYAQAGMALVDGRGAERTAEVLTGIQSEGL